MRILIVHNAYQQRGGEDSVVADEIALLQSKGHEVETYFRRNDDISRMSGPSIAWQTLWSFNTTHDVSQQIRRFNPDIIHAHNTFPLISPSLYWSAERANVPVVQTLHNFRFMCLNALFLRKGQVCEDCLGRLPWLGIVRKCYRGSGPASAVLAGMLTLHRALGTWTEKVSRYIALNEFCRDKFVAGGLPAEQISIKPNFADIQNFGGGPRSGGLFVGRLSSEKGISILLNALGQLPGAVIDFIGTGPEQAQVKASPNARMLGEKKPNEVHKAMSTAAWLIMPSIWYENFPRTLVEAFACGLPVITSRLGAMAELVDDFRTGLLFAPGDANDLAQKISWAEQHPSEMLIMGENARRVYEEKYTPEINHQQLMTIYQQAMVKKNTKKT